MPQITFLDTQTIPRHFHAYNVYIYIYIPLPIGTTIPKDSEAVDSAVYSQWYPGMELHSIMGKIVIHADCANCLVMYEHRKKMSIRTSVSTLRWSVQGRVRCLSWKRPTALLTGCLWCGCRQRWWRGCTCTAQWGGWVLGRWGEYIRRDYCWGWMGWQTGRLCIMQWWTKPSQSSTLHSPPTLTILRPTYDAM